MAVKGGGGNPEALKKGGDGASGSTGTGRGGGDNAGGSQSASKKSAENTVEDIIKTPPD